MSSKLRNVKVNEISLVKRGANNKKFYLTKSAETEDQIPMEDQNQKTPEQVALEKAQADLAAAQAKQAELEKAQADFAAQKAELEKAQKEAVDKAAALEKALADEKEAKEVYEAIQKAAKEYKDLPVKAEDLGPMLRKVRKADAATADALEAVLKSVAEIAKSNLDARGTTKAPEKTDSAWAEIQKRAKGLVDAKVVTTIEKGVAKVIADDKELYSRHEAESKAATR